MTETRVQTPAEKAAFALSVCGDLRNSVAMLAAPLGFASLVTAVELLAEAVAELGEAGPL